MGVLDGLYESYYENGQLLIKQNYKDNIEDGPCESYYENGQLAFKRTFKNGALNGLFEEYYENGQLKEKNILQRWILYLIKLYAYINMDLHYI